MTESKQFSKQETYTERRTGYRNTIKANTGLQDGANLKSLQSVQLMFNLIKFNSLKKLTKSVYLQNGYNALSCILETLLVPYKSDSVDVDFENTVKGILDFSVGQYIC